jgi:chromatin segregation and condensation protein Rec8/ScpA/Scc1 (kleisin family)
LDHFLPELSSETDENGTALTDALHWSSAWASTFSAGLELAKQGDVTLAQAEAFRSIHLTRSTVPLSA